jgi:hypothetical protein
MDRPLSSRAPQSGDADIKPAPATTNDKLPDHEDHDLTAEVLRNGVTVGTTPHLACFHLAGRAGKVPRDGPGI